MITQAQINGAVTAWDGFLQSAGIPAEFLLHDTKARFTLNVARRKKMPENVTSGVQQKGFEIQFMGFRWNAAAPRPPEKGDQVTVEGRRHAIESVTPHSIGTTVVGYVARVLG